MIRKYATAVLESMFSLTCVLLSASENGLSPNKPAFISRTLMWSNFSYSFHLPPVEIGFKIFVKRRGADESPFGVVAKC